MPYLSLVQRNRAVEGRRYHRSTGYVLERPKRMLLWPKAIGPIIGRRGLPSVYKTAYDNKHKRLETTAICLDTKFELRHV